MSVISRIIQMFRSSPRKPVRLRYFEDILAVEVAAINRRRAEINEKSKTKRLDVEKNPARPSEEEGRRTAAPDDTEGRRPVPGTLYRGRDGAGGPRGVEFDEGANPRAPKHPKMRPLPLPCDATGLALSGGGIRSAAVCLGALQALSNNGRVDSIDYLSTVSGGGYIGASLSGAMSIRGGGSFPFGSDVSDNEALAHLRNYSNYLMPRGHGAVRNATEAAAIVLRGILANAVTVFSLLLLATLLTAIAYPDEQTLGTGSFVVRLFYHGALTGIWSWPFLTTLAAVAALGLTLLAWTIAKSLLPQQVGGDTKGFMLLVSRSLLVAAVTVGFLELQPLLIGYLLEIHGHQDAWWAATEHRLEWIWGVLVAIGGAASTFSSDLGHFLKKSERTSRLTTMASRVAVKAALLLASAAIPAALWLLYLVLCAAAILQVEPPFAENIPLLPGLGYFAPIVQLYVLGWLAGSAISLTFGANSYSLHRFYRDRLSKAFLFRPSNKPELCELDGLKLSELQGSRGPYHIINTAINLQGSKEANKRGRDADFFIFTPDFVGSDLTMYTHVKASAGLAPTTDMEAVDPALNLATAMAISGAAVSANMGSNTIAPLSPTLAFLNARLGYWFYNPRRLGQRSGFGMAFQRIWRRFSDKLFLFYEIANMQDETRPVVYLTDGGHIENLGLYELLKRGCKTIIVVDAEADPDMAFPSFLKLERYARIDLGIKIVLPWEPIARMSKLAAKRIESGRRAWLRGGHCAVGRIFYDDGSVGTLLYFKSSVMGDEKDYILDYKRRNPSFPHETTGDQFFSEEQFEMYRALGFHMVEGFFSGSDSFFYQKRGAEAFATPQAARAEIDASIPAVS